MGKRFAYMLLGACIGVVLAETIILFKHHQLIFGWSLLPFALSSGTTAAYIAGWKGKVKSIRELERPITLFGPNSWDKISRRLADSLLSSVPSP